jgi:hypothetical protein
MAETAEIIKKPGPLSEAIWLKIHPLCIFFL